MAVMKDHYTAEEYEAAKHANAADYLLSIGYGLTRGRGLYKGEVHDSLIIRDDGRWFWNSRGKGGKSPVDLVKLILMEDYGYSDEVSAAIEAIKRLAGARGAFARESDYIPTPRHDTAARSRSPDEPGCMAEQRRDAATRPLPMPAPFRDNRRVMAYLCGTRGLGPEIVRGLMRCGKIYETVQRRDKELNSFVDTPFHNAVFVAYDNEKRPQSAFLRGTISKTDKSFKRDLEQSDKSFSFTLLGRKESGRVFCFEAAIDAISHASFYKITGQDWRDGCRLALGGTCFLGLERFLADNSQVRNITVCLDNDATGRRRGQKLHDEFTAKGYKVNFEYSNAKDWNEELLNEREGENENDY